MDAVKTKSNLAAAIANGFSVVMEADGNQVKGCPVAVKAEDVYSRYGQVDGYRMSMRILADDLPDTVKTGSRVTVGGRALRVLGVSVNWPAATIDLADVYGKG